MQKVTIKKTTAEDKTIYFVQALSLKNSENKTSLCIPHPQGNERLEYNTIEEAVFAVKQAGFDYILPDGETFHESVITNSASNKSDIEKLLFSKFKLKSDDINSSVAASALKALSYLNDSNSVDIYLSKIGEDNDKIREIAIEGLVLNRELVLEKLLNALSDANWVARNSAITALTKISEFADVELERILENVIKCIDDKNTIVQCNALISAGQIYRAIICKQNK